MRPITERSAVELAAAIRRTDISAREVVQAHINRHRQFGPRVNAIVADRYELALEEAEAADRLIAGAAPGEALPPLLGVPFTVKESIAVKGMPFTAGLVARRDVLAEESAPAVQRVIDAGAIALGVTNTSELTLWIESENRLYGRTRNPYDTTRTAGGSSGGEGAAVGYGGSPFGLASDIAGSIRVPALFCGVFAHKPSSGLVPNTGLYPPSAGESGAMLGTGPITRRAEDLLPLLKIIAGSNKVGESAQVRLTGLRVVTVEDASRLPIDQELRDSRERAIGALLSAGASVERRTLRTWRRAIVPFLATLQASSGQTTAELLTAAGEARPTMRELLRRRGPHTLPTRVTLAGERLGEARDSRLRRRLLATGRALGEELRDIIGDGVLLHPAHGRPAPKHGRTLGRPWLLTPAAIFNLARVPATEVPLGLSTRGLPVGVQVAAGAGRDHVSIAVALELERVFGGWVPPPAP